MSSSRLVRVSESIRGVLARLVTRERTLEGALLTITGVDVSPDLRHAKVFVSHLDGRTPDDQILHTLSALKEEWQAEINKALHIKYTPKLHFAVDEAQKRGDRILQIMSEIEPPAEDPGK
jgi:ribosome-binding factor A